MSSSSSGGSSGGGGFDFSGQYGTSRSVSDIKAAINSAQLQNKFAELEALIDELERAEQRDAAEAKAQAEAEAQAKAEEEAKAEDEANENQPGETPGDNPVDTGNTPNNDGSGIRQTIEGGFEYTFTANEDGTYNVYAYDPKGNLIDSFENQESTAFGEGTEINTIINDWYTAELTENYGDDWKNTESEWYQQNFGEQTEDPDTDTGTDTDTGNQTLDPETEDLLENVTFTAPDGTLIDFSEGNTNKGYRELEEKVDDAIEDYKNAEDDEEKEEALNVLIEADKNLEKFESNMADITEKALDQYKDEVAINDDLNDIIDSASTSEDEKEEARQQLLVSNARLNKLKDGYNRVNELNTKIIEETSADLSEVLNGDKDESSFLEDTKEILEWSAAGLGIIAGGTALWETWFGDDDIDTKSASELAKESVQAIKQNLPEAIALQKEFQPQITDLENQDNYAKLFGSDPANDFFSSDPKWQEGYDSYLLGPDGIAGSGDEPEAPLSKSDWLKQWMEANPETEDAKAYRDSYSAVGTQEKLLTRNMNNAANLYKPTEMGGMGFVEDDFRTKDQRKTMKLANELIDSPVNQMLEDSVMTELGKGGDMGDAYYGNMRNNILGGLAPSLSKQSGLLSGGVQRLAREMTGDNLRTLQARQSAASGYLNQRGNQLTNFSNLANANTVSSSSIFGLPSGSQIVGNQYAQSSQPTGSQLLADPTSAYAGAVGQQSILNDLLNYSTQESTSTKLTNTVNNLNNMMDFVDKGNELLNKED